MAVRTLSACLAEIKANPGKYYVYILFRPDGVPFYAGCGRVRAGRVKGAERITVHEREARAGKLSHKCNAIRSIWKSGNEIGYDVVEWRDSESDIFDAEISIIASIGRADLGRGPLTNNTDGGDGILNRTAAMRKRASDSIRALVDDNWRARASELARAHWNSPQWRQKRRIAAAQPESRARRSAASKASAAGPANMKRSITMKDVWLSEEYKALQAMRHADAVGTDEYRQNAAKRSRDRWNDPVYRERLRQSHRTRWAARKNSIPASKG